MARGGTSTVRRPLLRPGPNSPAPGRFPLLAAAGACALLCALALAATALVAVYVGIRAIGELTGGDGEDAARWGTLLFAAGGPLIVAYAAQLGYAGAVARLRGERRASVGVAAAAAAAAVVAICLVYQGSIGAGSYFVTDDWLHIVMAHDAVTGGALELDYLSRIVYIHYAPGHRFTYWAMDQLAPLDWGAGLVAMLVLFAGSLAMFLKICVRLFGRRPWNLALLLLFGTSVLLAPSFLWFADGVHKFPSVLLTLVAIDAYLAHRLDGRRRALWVAVAAVALASLFYVKALLVPLYLLLIRVLFLERSPKSALRAVLDERRTWLAFAPVYAIYLVNFFVNYSSEQASAPSLDLLGRYLWIAWFRGVTPAFMGVRVSYDAEMPELLLAFAAQALLVAVIAYTLWRKRSAWRAWTFWAVAFAANATVVALGRLGSLGLKQVGSQLRYDTEMTWLLPLALGFALYPGEVAGREPEPGSVRRIAWPSRRARIALVVAAACLYLAATFDTGHDIGREWRRSNSEQTKTYVANMRRDAARLERAGTRMATIDDQTPAFFIAPAYKPWNRLERFVPAITSDLRVVPADPRPLQVRQNGAVMPIALQALATSRTSIADGGALSLAGGERTRRGGRPCVAAPDGPATISFEPEKLLRGQSLFGRLDYDVVRRSRAPALLSANSYRGRIHRFALDSARGHAYLNLGHRLRVLIPRGAVVCARSSGVGWIAP